ncbi:major royal jelly protein 1-like [Anoplolepis gracilipes]|uniref:major royal jelly protein 1-like n=1 Tax=Anoplolepis gracilipes TaxID=354296 RepID=UPI003BA15F74
MKHLLFVISFLLVTIMSFAVDLKPMYEWKYVEYQWDSLQESQKTIISDNYNASSCILYDVDKAPDGRVFVTSVREKGVPASIMTVTDQMGEGGPLLRPYPEWSWYKNDNKDTKQASNKIDNDMCEGITSVYRVYIKDNHLFALDCGQIGDDQVCEAQLLVFDLLTNTLVKRVIIPRGIATNRNGIGLLTTLTVFVPHCKDIHDAIVLMADTKGYGLVVLDMQTSRFCRIESDFMKPTDTIFDIENCTFFLEDGILGITLVDKKLYYAPLSGDKIYKMKIPQQLECLLKESKIDNITEVAGILSGQTGPIASKDRAIFYSNMPETAIMCADTSKEINSNNSEVIAQDPKKLQFTSGMKVIHAFKSELMILTNRYERVICNTLNLNEINFRVFSMDIEKIQNKTNCFDSSDKEEKHKKCPKPAHKNGPPKGHKGKPGGGPPKGHKDKPEDRPSKGRKHGLGNKLPIFSKEQE